MYYLFIFLNHDFTTPPIPSSSSVSILSETLHFDSEEVKGVYFKLLRDATIDAVTKKNRKLAGEEVEASCSVVKAVGVSKPVRPIWSLTLKELEAFFF